MREVFAISEKYYYGISLIKNFVSRVFPEVDRQLDHWIGECRKSDDVLLSEQAMASIKHKKFHAQGGSVYALYPRTELSGAVSFITALQTISDYLDNLCDRAGVFEENSFRQLHLSMLDAVDPQLKKSSYYLYYPFKNDGGYLSSLVGACREQVIRLPSYNLVKSRIKKYIKLYSEMQSYKHIGLDIRESRLSSWASNHLADYPGIYWWEFSAAAGSTLCVFLLFAAASDPSLTEEDVKMIEDAYFPWVCGLHILLDYYIDSREDLQMGDLNFTSYYENLKVCEERLSLFIQRSMDCCSRLSYPRFHHTVVKGLLAMYLSDPKAGIGQNKSVTKSLIKKGGMDTSFYYNICRVLRSRGKL